jgi:hypothetical protein
MAVFLFIIEQSIALALSILPLAPGGAGFLAKQFGQSQAAGVSRSWGREGSAA